MAAPFLAGMGPKVWGAPAPSLAASGPLDGEGTTLVLLGTAGGPTWWPVNHEDSDYDKNYDLYRASAASALIVNGDMYIVDLGHGSSHRLAQAFNPASAEEKGYPTFLSNLKAIFFTHLHMDHTADYPAVLLCGYGAGIRPANPVKVIGPGSRGQLEADIYSARVPVMNPSNPTPGTTEMTEYIWKAYAQSINDFTRDDGWPDFTSSFDLHDIKFPKHIHGFVSPNKTPCVAMDPFTVYEDEDKGINVQAILVDHHQVFPSFAFRFNTPHGAVVFSGDTGPDTRGNLQRLASGADILVHEVIDPVWIDNTFSPDNPRMQPLRIHLQTAHTPIDKLGDVVKGTGVKKLVLSHIVPGNTPIASLRQAETHGAELIVGYDLLQVPIA